MIRALSYVSKCRFSIDYHRIANFDSDLHELRGIVRKFADQKVAPLAHKTDVEDKFPHHLWR